LAHPSEKPIGIFDSGTGGLTVARAVADLLPGEDLIYFGDTAHLPYGDKSQSTIQAYCIKICNLLLSREVKVILIACNTASAAAYELIKEYVGTRALVLNVIDPMVQLVSREYEWSKVGLIATKSTVASNVYLKKIDDLEQGIKLHSLPTPVLVTLIEEGFAHSDIIRAILNQYLAHAELLDIKALILGCTHYPLIKDEVIRWYKDHQRDVNVLDSSSTVAKALEHLLGLHGLLRQNRDNSIRSGTREFLVSDLTTNFAESTSLFFGEEVSLRHYPLWE
jgi:glutamate racemase